MSNQHSYRKKPVVIQAMKFTGGNLELIQKQIGLPAVGRAVFDESIIIGTTEGDMRAKVGDWIIKGVNGEFYPCKPDVFEKTYEKVTDKPKGKSK